MIGKKFFVLFFTIAIASVTHGQFLKSPDDNKIHFGFSGGYVQSEIKGSFVNYQLDHYFGKKPELFGRDGIEIEAQVNFKIYKFLYAKTGLGYNEQGGEIKYSGLVHPIDITLRYLHLPVSLGAHLLTLNKFAVAAEGGLQLNQEISSDQDFKNGTINENWSKTFIPAYTYRVLIEYQINPKLSIQGSYKYVNSLTSFYEEEYFTGRNEMSTKAKSYSLGLLLSMP